MLRNLLPQFRSAEIKRGAHQIAAPLGVSGKLPLVGGIAAAIAGVVAAATLAAGPAASSAWWVLAGTAGFFVLGLADDVRKTRTGRGVPEGVYLAAAFVLSVGATALLIGPGAHASGAASPYALAHWLGPEAHVPLSVWYLALILGTTLAASFSDGMDGLTPGTVTIAAIGAALVAALSVQPDSSRLATQRRGHRRRPACMEPAVAVVAGESPRRAASQRLYRRQRSLGPGSFLGGRGNRGRRGPAVAGDRGTPAVRGLVVASASQGPGSPVPTVAQSAAAGRFAASAPAIPPAAASLTASLPLGDRRPKSAKDRAGLLDRHRRHRRALCSRIRADPDGVGGAGIALAAAVGAVFWGAAMWTRPAFVSVDGDFLLLFHGRPIRLLGWPLARHRRVVGDADAAQAAADRGLLNRPMNAHVLDSTVSEMLAELERPRT